MPKLLKCTKKKPGNGAFVLDDGDHAAPQIFAEPPGKRPHFKLLSRGRYGTRPDVLVFDEARFALSPCERPSANLRNLRLRLQSIFLLAPALQSSDYGPDAPVSGAPQIRQTQSASMFRRVQGSRLFPPVPARRAVCTRAPTSPVRGAPPHISHPARSLFRAMPLPWMKPSLTDERAQETICSTGRGLMYARTPPQRLPIE